jgi:branched-chain amino acid aminotransferase
MAADVMVDPGPAQDEAAPRITVEHAPSSRFVATDWKTVPFGSVYSDHMLVAEHRDGRWNEVTLRPYGPLPLFPSISGLQYGLSVFEGLKAHRSPSGDILLFRPLENARRLRRSAARLVMPEVPETLFLEGVKALVHVDEKWVPAHGSGALYIRPVLFSTDTLLRPKPGERFLFVVFSCPFVSYYPAALDVMVTRRHVRAFPGGTGDIKPGGNYAPTFFADVEARARDCQTVLWLDGPEHRYLEECGAMNVFLVLGDQVVTPELRGTILAGVTRDSVITLLGSMGHRVEERRVSIDEVEAAHREGRLRECFGTGTAATVSSVRRIHFDGEDLVLPPIGPASLGPLVRERLLGIMSGRDADTFGWTERVGGDARP